MISWASQHGAEKILQERLLANEKIDIIWDHQLEEVLGENSPPGVAGARLKHVTSSEERILLVQGIFVAIGHTPNTAIFQGQIETDAEGYIVTHADSTATNIAGVFAAGDVQDKTYRQAVTAAGTGCMAALEAEKFIAEMGAGVTAAAE